MQLQESFHGSYISEHQSHNGNNESCTISFLISTYNRARYVEECVQQLLSIQTPYSFEVIVRDNGSEDNTKAVIEKINDPRLRYVRAPRNQGTISFLEVGKLANGEIITWLSDEDNFEYQHLDYVVNTFREDPACSVLVGGVTVGPHFTEVIFPEKMITDIAEALLFTLQFSGCGGVFIRGRLFKSNCDLHLPDTYEAYKTWNYYPIGFFATACLEQKLVTTSKILVRQARQAPTTNNWSDVGKTPGKPRALDPHYYPKSIYDRLYSDLVIVFEKKNVSLGSKLRIVRALIQSFRYQINALLHPGLIKLLSDNYPGSSVEAYQRHVQENHLHVVLVRKLWITYKITTLLLRFVIFYGGVALNPGSRSKPRRSGR